MAVVKKAFVFALGVILSPITFGFVITYNYLKNRKKKKGTRFYYSSITDIGNTLR